ncbi:hypothetical protein F0562_034002 [Nyssa sinensis]|uniref:HTH myb-type domain-containing protein n=1 Tax=Nyssa sinensis TaxID=561372 RepID=A0A5J5AG74_9ASTE|nr:hypothetical protein F0562_034002 [Nyssa sinensis]
MINDNHTEKMQRCQEYIEALEEERRKIQVFQRELPLCLELVTRAIDAYKQQLSGTSTEYFLGQSECSEQTSSDGPVLEEFIPIKRTSDDDDDEQQSHNSNNNDNKNNEKLSKKSDWLRSVQLWNQSPDQPIVEDTPKKVSVMEVKRNGGGAFHPFKREKSAAIAPPLMGSSPSVVVQMAAASSTTETGGSGSNGGGESKKEEKGGDSQRKARRCWSPELHRRFLHALKQLGGCHVATPKQIRELMKVDGLTNDEVKSHLQKYRLHTRRPSPSIHNNPQAPQFVLVGGIWVPPPEYTAVAATTTTGEAAGAASPNGIYAPIAAPPPRPHHPQASATETQRQQHKQSKQLHSDERGSHSEGGAHSNSPATSSSTHTTTASRAL